MLEWGARPGGPLARVAERRFKATQAACAQEPAGVVVSQGHGKRPAASRGAVQASPKRQCLAPADEMIANEVVAGHESLLLH